MKFRYRDSSGLGDLVFDDEKNEVTLWVKVSRFNGFTHLHKTKGVKSLGEARSMLEDFIESQQYDERRFFQSKTMPVLTREDPTKGIF